MKEINKTEELVTSFLLQGFCKEGLISQRVADAVSRRVFSDSEERGDGHERADNAA